MSVLERLVANAITMDIQQKIEIILIDNCRVGQGRIWDSTQSKNYIMNTLSTEISAFSGHGSVDTAKPGKGPSFSEWWKENYDDFDHYQGYAPRRYYGEYLSFVHAVVKACLPRNVTLIDLNDTVLDIDVDDKSCNIICENSNPFMSNTVIMTTGHSTNKYLGKFNDLQNFASTQANLQFIAGDSSSEIDFSVVKPMENVGIIGLGLSFFDVVAELTEGRGGQFIEVNGASLIYQPSGLEPKLYCGSRSGVPIFSRGRNEKPSDYKYKHAIFTHDKISQLRVEKNGNLDFHSDVWSLLEAEINYAYFAQIIRNQQGESAANMFTQTVAENNIEDSKSLAFFASEALSQHTHPLDLAALARPFEGIKFDSSDSWNQHLVKLLKADLAAAENGNLGSPLKSALDVLRNSRDNLRAAIDFGGLSPQTHKNFLSIYMPIITLLSAGPPLFRTKQLLALMDAGIVSIVPPSMDITTSRNGYVLMSGAYDGYKRNITTLIDARVPVANLQLDENQLTRNLYDKGVYSSFVNKGENGDEFVTGGVNVTDSPFNPIGKDGTVYQHIFVLGIPTEHTRWFMQSGSSRPAHWIDFMIDADNIAKSALNILG
ncbi:hypothetical protein PE36_22605 [Moritella sp. PE36]|nr:hypothetical protein PE36_22605 [Moritella sp. PE36]